MNDHTKYGRGFILLFAILSIGFLLAITVNLADSLYKQHKFLSFSSESLDALNNSNAGIECAMYWDRKFDAFNPTKSTSIYCGRQKFTVGNQQKSTFTLLNDDGTQSTVVEVDKTTQPGTTTITAAGYNTINITAEKRVNRTLEVSYADREVSTRCAAYDIVLSLDVSTSLSGQDRTDSVNAANLIADNIELSPTLGKIGVTWFYALSNLQIGLSTDATAIKQAVNFSYNNPAIGGDTNMPGGLIRSYNELMAHGRANAPDFVVVITDGETNECSDLSGNRIYCPGTHKYYDSNGNLLYWTREDSMAQSVQYAKILKDAGVTIIVVGVGVRTQGVPPNPGGITKEQYETFLRDQIASKDSYFPVIDRGHLSDTTKGFDCSFFSRVKGTPTTKEQ